MNPLKKWMTLATPAEQRTLASSVGTSAAYLHQLAGEFRQPSAGMARLIEQGTERFAQSTQGRLPVVYRTDINEACRGCDFAAKCLGPIAVRSEFSPVVGPRCADSEGGHVD